MTFEESHKSFLANRPKIRALLAHYDSKPADATADEAPHDDAFAGDDGEW
jgi:hypothetical protein